MKDRLQKVSQLQVLRNLLKFATNPIPIIDDTFIDFEDDSYRVNLGGMTKAIITKDPDFIKHILQKGARNYQKSILQTEHLATFIGKGLLTSNGEYWLKQRRLIQPGFHKKALDSFVEIMQVEVGRYVERLKKRVLSGEHEIIMLKEMSYLTLRIVSKALFSVGIDDDQIAQFGSKVDHLQEAIIQKVRQPFLAWWRKISGTDRKNSIIAQELYDLVTGIIQDRKSSKEQHGDILDMLLAARYEDNGEGMTDQQLLDECLVLFAAGYETTANALTWTFYLLDQHRDHQHKVLDEINKESIDPNDRLQTLMQYDYIRQVVSESMRLYPPVWMIDRIALEPDHFDGVNITTDEIVNAYVYGVHHDPKHWDNPYTFQPNRFAREKLKSIKAYTYFPFGGGPRLCIGQQFAMMELQLIVSRLLKDFSFTLNEDLPIQVVPSITLRAKSGIKMKVALRN